MRYLILSLILLSACGDDVEPYTWGDAVEEVVVAFCEEVQACYPDTISEENKIYCIKHSIFHLCQAEETCNEELEEGAEDLVSTCVEAIPGFNCTSLSYFGALPEECTPVFELNPNKKEDE